VRFADQVPKNARAGAWRQINHYSLGLLVWCAVVFIQVSALDAATLPFW